jgi:D-serine deaminase-like pyridoxal phosphate-dependent protein
VPRLVVGGTPSFPAFARLDLPGLECSPGTCFLHDDSYGRRFADLAPFRHAALLLTRVISRPTPTRVTLDLGYKAVASDPPAGRRCRLLGIGPYEAILQNEEHLVLETPQPDRFTPGDEFYATPTHVCPTVALHRQAHVIEDGRVTSAWDIVGRDRVLTI